MFDKIFKITWITAVILFVLSVIFGPKHKSIPELNTEQFTEAKNNARNEFEFYKNLDGVKIERKDWSIKPSSWSIFIQFYYDKNKIDFPALITSRGFVFWKNIGIEQNYCKNGLLLSFIDSDPSNINYPMSTVISFDKSVDCLSIR